MFNDVQLESQWMVYPYFLGRTRHGFVSGIGGWSSINKNLSAYSVCIQIMGWITVDHLICIYIYIHMYVYIYICMYIYTYVCIHNCLIRGHVGLPEKIDGTAINLMVILSATFKSERWQIIATDPWPHHWSNWSQMGFSKKMDGNKNWWLCENNTIWNFRHRFKGWFGYTPFLDIPRCDSRCSLTKSNLHREKLQNTCECQDHFGWF